jgi:hypothetical protein
MRFEVGLFVLICAGPLLSAAEISISFPAERSAAAIDGHVVLLLSTDPSEEPRFQYNESIKTQLAFGLDVDDLRPGALATFDRTSFGYPIRSLAEVPEGDYFAQAVLIKYETFRRADGHVVKLPADRGEGRQWNKTPGNLYNKPVKVHWNPNSQAVVRLSLDLEIPPIAEPADTKYIKHVKIRSELLTKFWGRPVYLGAHVLLPEGFDAHPNVRFPLAVYHGHFPSDFAGFRTEPPDPNLKPDFDERFSVPGYNRIQQEEAYRFYKTWSGPDFPRMLIVEIQHANPYYDDSYAVNSANLGPYGDAIETELIPYIENKFRGIGEGWARFLYGGSTGGWESLAAQIFYPDRYNGVFAACPDPIDFREYTLFNIYKDPNAYFVIGPHKKVARPGVRNYQGHLRATLQDLNYFELPLGTHSRSGQQWDIWDAVFSPVGTDGYPQPIFDKLTGEIDHKVAEYWREHFDLGAILKRDWPSLGPKLQGKIHIYCGSADNYFLNNAVYLVEDILKKTANPPAQAEVAYGDRAEHCWNGDPSLPNYLSRLHYNTMYVPKIIERIEKSAPAGADLKSWRY